MEEAKAILSAYDIPDENIIINPYANPLSSYFYKIDDGYRNTLVEMFDNKYSMGTTVKISTE